MKWTPTTLHLPAPINAQSGRSAPVLARLANGHEDTAIYMTRTGRWICHDRAVAVTHWRSMPLSISSAATAAESAGK